jgi:phosphoribosylformylglycinamidine synthase
VQVSGGATSTARAPRKRYIGERAVYHVTVSAKAGLPDPRGAALQKDVRDLGIRGLRSARVSDIYTITGDVTHTCVERICRELLADTPVQDYSVGVLIEPAHKGVHVIEIVYNPGVPDPAEDAIRKGIRDLGIEGVESVKTARRYYLGGLLNENTVKTIAGKLLMNPAIQHMVTG